MGFEPTTPILARLYGPHVGAPLIETFKTLAMPPMSFGPQTVRNAWPRYKIEWEDLLAREQAEARG
jgi:hypothetical protein